MIKKLLNIAFCLCFLASVEVKAQDTCHVALMVPLYLEQVDEAFFEAEPSNKTLLTKPFSFLHFYEGFMMAADSVVNSRNMKLDLKVYDVDNVVNKAYDAVADPWLANADLIKLKMSLRDIDPNAFVNVIESAEVMGNGFVPLPHKDK